MEQKRLITLNDMYFKDDISYFNYLEWKRERKYRLNRDDIEFLYRIVRESIQRDGGSVE